MATSKIPKSLQVISDDFPTNWTQLVNNAAAGTITISAVRDAGTAMGSPVSPAYSYGSLITIKPAASYTTFAILQIFVPDTNSASADKIYMKTGGQWLAVQGTGVPVVTG